MVVQIYLRYLNNYVSFKYPAIITTEIRYSNNNF